MIILIFDNFKILLLMLINIITTSISKYLYFPFVTNYVMVITVVSIAFDLHDHFISKAFFSFFQIRFMSKQDNSGLSRPFQLLGYLSLAQLMVSAAVQIYSAWKTADRNTDRTADISRGMYVSVQS